jgi:hypothetical protein
MYNRASHEANDGQQTYNKSDHIVQQNRITITSSAYFKTILNHFIIIISFNLDYGICLLS